MSAVERLNHADGKPRPYSATATFGGVVWACGQIPANSQGEIPESMADQLGVAMDNLEQVLTAAGASLSTLLKLTIYIADFDEFDEYNEAYQRRLDGHALPPRTTVQVARFRGKKRIEIDAVAAVES